MDTDYKPNDSPLHSNPAINPVHHSFKSEPVKSTVIQDDSPAQPAFPYLAKLVAFSVVFLSVLCGLSTITNFLIEKLLVGAAPATDYSYFAGVDSFLVISAIATLVVSIPAAILLLALIRRSENKEVWRMSQKWRRIIYTIVQVVLVLSIISTLIGTVYSVFSHSLNLEVGSSYSGYYDDSAKKPDVGSEVAAAIFGGLVTVIILSLGIVTFASEYAAKWRQVAWGVLGIFIATAAIVGAFSVIKIQDQIEQDKKDATSSNLKPNYDDYTQPEEDGLSSASGTAAQTTLDGIKSDLSYYAGQNSDKYPTKAQWDDGSLKPKYLLSDEATLKKVSYTPDGCTASGCSSYTLSMTDEKGKTIKLMSSDQADGTTTN